MLKRTTVFLDAKALKELQRIGRRKGGLAVSQMIRIAIVEYIRREKRKGE